MSEPEAFPGPDGRRTQPQVPGAYGSGPVPGPYGSGQVPAGQGSGWPSPGYGPGYPVGPPYLAREHPQGTTVLVLGILSLVVCPITGIFAITIGGRTLKEIDANPGVWSNRQSVAAGRVLGIVAVAVYGSLLGGYLVFAVVLAGIVAMQGH